MSSMFYVDGEYGYAPKRLAAPTVQRSTGKIVPVPKPTNPYRPQASTGQSNLLTALSQQSRIQSKPLNTQIQAPSYESDPVLARIRALGQQNVDNARSEAAALRKQAVMDTGLVDVGREIGLDASSLEAAQQNPFSLRAKIERDSLQAGSDLDETLNQQNLYYSGARAERLGELGRNTAEAQSNLGRQLRDALAGINQGVTLAEQEQARLEQAQLEETARAEREAALQQAYLDSLAAALGGGQAVAAPTFDSPVAPGLPVATAPGSPGIQDDGTVVGYTGNVYQESSPLGNPAPYVPTPSDPYDGPVVGEYPTTFPNTEPVNYIHQTPTDPYYADNLALAIALGQEPEWYPEPVAPVPSPEEYLAPLPAPVMPALGGWNHSNDPFYNPYF